ncbi:unnamed protein product [Amoebophrya sp. A120]|nr:unnamed protein product [Amoebophrya sp. A120]|eukprot:GSA120T00003378001.1
MEAAESASSQFLDDKPVLKTWQLPRAFKLKEDAMLFTRSEFDAAVAAGRGFDEVWTTRESGGCEKESKRLFLKTDRVCVLPDDDRGPVQFLKRARKRLDEALVLKATELGPELKNPSSSEKYCDALQRFSAEVVLRLRSEASRWRDALQEQCTKAYKPVSKHFVLGEGLGGMFGSYRPRSCGAFIENLNTQDRVMKLFDVAPIAVKIIHGFSDEVIAEGQDSTALPRVLLRADYDEDNEPPTPLDDVPDLVHSLWDCKWLREFASKTHGRSYHKRRFHLGFCSLRGRTATGVTV